MNPLHLQGCIFGWTKVDLYLKSINTLWIFISDVPFSLYLEAFKELILQEFYKNAFLVRLTHITNFHYEPWVLGPDEPQKHLLTTSGSLKKALNSPQITLKLIFKPTRMLFGWLLASKAYIHD